MIIGNKVEWLNFGLESGRAIDLKVNREPGQCRTNVERMVIRMSNEKTIEISGKGRRMGTLEMKGSTEIPVDGRNERTESQAN